MSPLVPHAHGQGPVATLQEHAPIAGVLNAINIATTTIPNINLFIVQLSPCLIVLGRAESAPTAEKRCYFPSICVSLVSPVQITSPVC
jgi:hypothetical protein